MSKYSPEIRADVVESIFQLVDLAATENVEESSQLIERVSNNPESANAFVGYMAGLLTELAAKHYPGGLDAYKAEVRQRFT